MSSESYVVNWGIQVPVFLKTLQYGCDAQSGLRTTLCKCRPQGVAWGPHQRSWVQILADHSLSAHTQASN